MIRARPVRPGKFHPSRASASSRRQPRTRRLPQRCPKGHGAILAWPAERGRSAPSRRPSSGYLGITPLDTLAHSWPASDCSRGQVVLGSTRTRSAQRDEPNNIGQHGSRAGPLALDRQLRGAAGIEVAACLVQAGQQSAHLFEQRAALQAGG